MEKQREAAGLLGELLRAGLAGQPPQPEGELEVLAALEVYVPIGDVSEAQSRLLLGALERLPSGFAAANVFGCRARPERVRVILTVYGACHG